MSTWLEGLLLSSDPRKQKRGMEHIRSTLSEPSRRRLAGALARHGALVEALEQLAPMPWPDSPARAFACECAQAALDIRSSRYRVEPFCTIALHRAAEVARGNLPVSSLDDAAFMARSAVNSGTGLAAEAVLAACHINTTQAARGAARALRLLGEQYNVPPRIAAPDALRERLIALVATI